MTDIRAVTYHNAVAATQSDTAADPNGPFAAIQNTGASATCKISTVGNPTGSVTIYMVQGLIYPIATQRIWSTNGLSTVIGFNDASRMWKGTTG
jgi:hypothetical protein